MELAVVAREALSYCRTELQMEVARVYVGPYMTALDMAGCSLTLLATAASGPTWHGPAYLQQPGSSLLDLLDDPTAAHGWPGKRATVVDKVPAPVPSLEAMAGEGASASGAGGEPATEQGRALGAALRAACSALVAAGPELDALDAKVGDGDCGATLARGASAVLAALEGRRYSLDSPEAAALQVAHSVRHAVGGSSGALYDIFITAAAGSLKVSGYCGALVCVVRRCAFACGVCAGSTQLLGLANAR